MENKERIKTYEEFWPYYLSEHSKYETKLLHAIGTLIGIAVFLNGLITGCYWLLVFSFVIGYAFAWASHFFIEKNKPATFQYPLWSFISDYRMLYLFLLGRYSKTKI